MYAVVLSTDCRSFTVVSNCLVFVSVLEIIYHFSVVLVFIIFGFYFPSFINKNHTAMMMMT